MAYKWEVHKYSDGRYYWVKTKDGIFSAASTKRFRKEAECTQDAIKDGMIDPSIEMKL